MGFHDLSKVNSPFLLYDQKLKKKILMSFLTKANCLFYEF